MKIVVGTRNQKKLHVVETVFKNVLQLTDVTVIGHDVDSRVPEAPHDQETYQGALNRAVECQTLDKADYYIGLESGLANRYGNYFEEAWAVIITKTNQQLVGYSSGLILPPVVVERMNNGDKHNEIMDYFDKLFDLPKDNRDTWSRYTGGNISRQISLEEAVRNALIQSSKSTHNLYRFDEA